MKPQVRVVALLAAVAGIAVVVALGIARRSNQLELRAEGDDAAVHVQPSEAVATPPVPQATARESVSEATVPPVPVAPEDVPQLVRTARRLLEQGDAQAAESLLVGVVTAAPTATAWNVMGRVHLARGAQAAAQAAFAQACALDSTHAWARNNLGWMYLQAGDWRQAMPLLEDAVRLDDGVPAFHNNLAVAYERARRYGDAAAAYARTLDLHPEHPTASDGLARVQAAEALAASRALEVTAGADSSDRASRNVEIDER